MRKEEIIEEFLEELGSSSPVPGGGGAAALSGALSVSLAAMVCNLTIGKKRYQDVEEDLRQDLDYLIEMREIFLSFMDKDEEVFLPLSKAYALPNKTEEEKRARALVMRDLLKNAAEVPLRLLELADTVLDTIKDVAEKGSRLAISDAGVSAAFMETCVHGALLNVQINTKAMKDEEMRSYMDGRAQALSASALQKCETIRNSIL